MVYPPFHVKSFDRSWQENASRYSPIEALRLLVPYRHLRLAAAWGQTIREHVNPFFWVNEPMSQWYLPGITPLVYVYITMEHHHFFRKSTKFLWPFSSSQTVNVDQAGYRLQKSAPWFAGKLAPSFVVPLVFAYLGVSINWGYPKMDGL